MRKRIPLKNNNRKEIKKNGRKTILKRINQKYYIRSSIDQIRLIGAVSVSRTKIRP